MDKLERLIRNKIPGGATGIEVKKGICTICDPGTQCGLDCYVKDGRIVKIEGSLEHPQNEGTLCAKGAAQRQWIYHEDRVRTPLKRVGVRGSGEFVPITWTEALDVIACELNRIRAESGPESVVFFSGYPKQLRPFAQRLAMLWGSPNWATESSTCATAMFMAYRLVYGQIAVPDLPNTRCVLAYGVNPFHSETPAARHLFDARDRGVKFIVADPRPSPFAAMADIHLSLRPGTDGALALAMGNVILSKGLYDRQFCAEWTRGFEDYKVLAAAYTLDVTERITGVPAAKIYEAAVLYATSKPASIMPSASPVVHHTNGVQNHRAILVLAGLTGNFDVPGGNVAPTPGWLEVDGAGVLTREHEFQVPRPWSELPQRVGAGRFPVWAEMVDQAQSLDIPEQINTGEPYPLKALVAFGLNYRMWPDSEGFLETIQKLDFIVDVDPFLTDTAKYADIVLPTCSSVERSEMRCYPQQHIVYTCPVITPLGESRSDTDIIFALADKLGVDYNPASDAPEGVYLDNGAPDFAAPFEAAVDWILEPSGMRIEDLKKHPGGMPIPNPIPLVFKKYEMEGFPTPSGKMEFASSILEKHSIASGIDSLPTYQEPKYSPLSAPEMAEEYPFVLNTGTRLPMFIHSRTFRLPWTRSLRLDVMADLNPLDAERLAIEQGDEIEIVTPTGSIRVKANVTELSCPGVVHMLHDYREADVNTLVEGDYRDPISGFPGFKGLLCDVRKAPPTSGVNPEVKR